MVLTGECATSVRCVVKNRMSIVLSSFAEAFQIFKLIVEEVIEIGGSDDDLRSLHFNRVKRRRVAEAIIGRKAGVESLLSDECLIFVQYSQREITEKYFSNIWTMSHRFHGRPWVRYCSSADIDESDGNRIMRLFHFPNSRIKREEIIRRANEEGYRPATVEELYAFTKCYRPRLLLEWCIAVFGSYVVDDDKQQYMPAFNVYRHALCDVRFSDDDVWNDRYWFLFVRQ